MIRVFHNGVEVERREPKPRLGLGDRIARIATPAARILRLPCIDPSTGQPKPESGCAKRKRKLNELGDKLKRKVANLSQK